MDNPRVTLIVCPFRTTILSATAGMSKAYFFGRNFREYPHKTWFSDDFPRVFLCFSHFPIVFLWFSHFPMIFLGLSHAFPIIHRFPHHRWCCSEEKLPTQSVRLDQQLGDRLDWKKWSSLWTTVCWEGPQTLNIHIDYIYIHICVYIPVVPHKAVAEVSK